MKAFVKIFRRTMHLHYLAFLDVFYLLLSIKRHFILLSADTLHTVFWSDPPPSEVDQKNTLLSQSTKKQKNVGKSEKCIQGYIRTQRTTPEQFLIHQQHQNSPFSQKKEPNFKKVTPRFYDVIRKIEDKSTLTKVKSPCLQAKNNTMHINLRSLLYITKPSKKTVPINLNINIDDKSINTKPIHNEAPTNLEKSFIKNHNHQKDSIIQSNDVELNPGPKLET